MSDFPAALPHGPLQPLFPDVFLVHGSMNAGPLVSFPRNMVVLRDGAALTVVNPVRLSEAGEQALAALGDVQAIVRLGVYHQRDDAWYRHRYPGARTWSAITTDSPDERLVDGGPSPHPRASVFVFQAAEGGEAALIVEQPEGGLLITCDSVQNWETTEGCSFMAGLIVRAMGFLTPAKIGPIWAKELTGGHPGALRPDFDRLLAMDWRHLIGAHGVPLRDGAKEALRASCDRALRG